MAEERPLKSSLEIAMERLRQKDAEAGIVARPLSDALKNAIADVRRFYEAKIAEQEVLHQSRVRGIADPAERETLDADWRREREHLTEECQRKVDSLRRSHDAESA